MPLREQIEAIAARPGNEFSPRRPGRLRRAEDARSTAAKCGLLKRLRVVSGW